MPGDIEVVGEDDVVVGDVAIGGFAGEGAVAVSSAFLPQLESISTAEKAHKAVSEQVLMDVFITVLAKTMDQNASSIPRTDGE